ncbi:MAG: CheY-like receiver [Phenylobacterium sp.]|nr:CheY-like receiver [Phenylobacterium sp.]
MAAAALRASTARRILVVEDEHHVCELISDMLMGDDLEIECVTTDREAYRRLSRSGVFDALLVDINLRAGTTGFDVARFARQLNPRLPVVYVSGQASKASIETFGVADSAFVEKPFTAEQLQGAVRRVLGED